MIKAVVFDLDHTLFDRYATINKLVPQLRKHFDLADGITDEFFIQELSYADKHFVHKGWRGIYNYLVEKGIFKTVPSFSEYTEIVLRHFKHLAEKYEFAVPTLEKIRSMGYRIGLITNGNATLQYKKLEMLELTEEFDEIIVSGDTPYEKPDKEIFLMMAEKMGIEPGEMMYVGDHPLNDVEGSRNAGCISVWVKTTGTWIFPEIEKPALQIETVEELPSLLEEING
ncbi:MAG: HAD family hydrolase [Clostridia bacterium]|nr:HAD family hydrolase [Clostridia bacterium]